MSEYIVEMYDECEKYVLEYGCKPTYTQGFPLREEIVRCRDCVWFTNSSHYGAYCTNFGSPLGDDYDGFCAWGERE